jgi:hypothetical protein
MNAAELAAVIVAVTPGVVALAKMYRQTDQVRKLEEQRPKTGDRFAELETKVDHLRGQVDVLLLVLKVRRPTAENRTRALGEPVDRGDIIR